MSSVPTRSGGRADEIDPATEGNDREDFWLDRSAAAAINTGRMVLHYDDVILGRHIVEAVGAAGHDVSICLHLQRRLLLRVQVPIV
jgi:hypothetical protein